MKTLKSTPLKRWYRVENNVIYDILTKEPNFNIVKDAIAWNGNKYNSQPTTNEEDYFLPRFVLYYGYIDGAEMTIVDYKKYLYLDSYIEDGDSITSMKVIPNINNGELNKDSDKPSYFQIHKSDIINNIYTKIINETQKDKIMEILPLYFQTPIICHNVENVYQIPPETIMIDGLPIVINCVSIDLENIYYIDETIKSENFSKINYDEIVVDCVNSYCKNIANRICEKQKMVNYEDYHTQDTVKIGTYNTENQPSRPKD